MASLLLSQESLVGVVVISRAFHLYDPGSRVLGSVRGLRFIDLNLTPKVFHRVLQFPPSANSTFTPISEQ